MRKVLVTGASRGIGAAIAEIFKVHGYEVSAPSHQELDLSDEKSIEKFIQSHQDVTYDVIINNAGINDINEIENVKDIEIDQMIAINLTAPIKLLRGFVGNMKQAQYGRIVNIGSIWGVVSKEGRCVYSATKNGIHGVTNTLDAMCEIMNEIKKGELDRVTFKTDSLRKYFPKSYTNKQMEDKIIQLLEQWQKKREKSMER